MLVFLLRLSGSFTSLAFLAMLLPVDWMDAIHRALGLGELPRAPVVDYLARSVAALYGFHGVLLLLVSTNPVKYRDIVWFIAILNIVFGAMMYTVASVQGSFEALRSFNAVTHFTHFTVAHAHIGMYGFVSMVLFGGMYFAVPRVLDIKWPHPALISLHFWLVVARV